MPVSSPPVRGDIARALRLARGHILRDVVDGTGIHIATLSLIEHGKRPGTPHLAGLSRFLGVPVDVLAGHRPALAVLREAADIPAATLAAAVGITPEHLARLEAGEEIPDVRLSRKLAGRLDVPATCLAWAPVQEAAA